MKKGQDRDAVVGALVLVTAALLFVLVYGKDAHSAKGDGYTLQARFRHADGITVGADVRLSGKVIGKVLAEQLDGQYRAVTTLHIPVGIQLPTDSSATIQTDGLLGSKYIELRPGAQDEVLKPGAEIDYTQDSVVLEDLLELIINRAKAQRGYLDRPMPKRGT